jgi:acyl carrier protein
MRDGKEIEATVLARIVEAVPPPHDRGKVALDTHLRRDLGLDSLGLASFLFRCGEGLDVDPDELVEVLAATPIHTVGDAVAVFARLLGGATPEARA